MVSSVALAKEHISHLSPTCRERSNAVVKPPPRAIRSAAPTRSYPYLPGHHARKYEVAGSREYLVLAHQNVPLLIRF